MAAGAERVPWLMIERLEAAAFRLQCVHCGAILIVEGAETAPDSTFVHQAAAFRHVRACLVPGRLEKARAAWTN
jgi:hypothetical protein